MREKIDIDSSLERLTVCSEKSCNPSIIVYKSSSLQVPAVITANQAKLHSKTGSGDLEERRSYLIDGDKVKLLDFFQAPNDLYYEVEYISNKSTTTGWIRATQLIVHPETGSH